MNQVKTTVRYSDGVHAEVRASEPNTQIGDGSQTLGWIEWTAIFFIAINICMMIFWVVHRLAMKVKKTIVVENTDDGEIERFKQYRETWNRVAKDCIAIGKDCDMLERSKVKTPSKDKTPCKPKDNHKSKLHGKKDEEDPVMPDNQEWGEW